MFSKGAISWGSGKTPENPSVTYAFGLDKPDPVARYRTVECCRSRGGHTGAVVRMPGSRSSCCIWRLSAGQAPPAESGWSGGGRPRSCRTRLSRPRRTRSRCPTPGPRESAAVGAAKLNELAKPFREWLPAPADCLHLRKNQFLTSRTFWNYKKHKIVSCRYKWNIFYCHLAWPVVIPLFLIQHLFNAIYLFRYNVYMLF